MATPEEKDTASTEMQLAYDRMFASCMKANADASKCPTYAEWEKGVKKGVEERKPDKNMIDKINDYMRAPFEGKK